ncbi:YqgE/AlgH family protein [uncultured Corynebacterium sp.]|uniref:YqgE/AlgH family protein n=1 Tax=uncultured Corynebacterium sp. TaxID=159447 RepID=UPI0025FF3F07|nr:YqgE/AlgH family protein [uncultured Corynebacterium sp.]
MVDRSTSSSSDANEPRGSHPQRIADIRPGRVIYVSPQVVFDDLDRVLTGDVLLVISVDDDHVTGVYLDQMTTEAVANQLPALAQKLTKPKVFFLGGSDVPGAVVAIGQLGEEVDIPEDSGHSAGDTEMSPEDVAAGDAPRSASATEPVMLCEGHALLIDAQERLAQVVIAENQELDVPVEKLRLFVGFTELERAELDQWLAEGLVKFQRAVAEDVFGTKPGETWRQLMKRRPFPENLFSTWAQHPERN